MNWLHANHPPFRGLIAASALTLGLGLTAGQALAEGSDDAPAVKVSYADLNLSRQEGAEALYSRIKAAAHSVCGRVDGRDIERSTLRRQCYDASVEAALKQVDHEGLYAVHLQEQGTGIGLSASRPATPTTTMR